MTWTPQRTAHAARKRIGRHLPRGYHVVLFGSWAKGTATKTSDIDLGIVGRRSLPLKVMHAIREDIDALPTLRKIEVVDLQAVAKTYKKNVLIYAKQL